MDNNNYKVIADNLGEYSVLTKDNELIVTEIQNKATAELFCDKLNELYAYNKEYRETYSDLNRKFNKLIRLCDEFNINWKQAIE